MEYGYHPDGTPKNSIWPKLMPKDELVARTREAYDKYLSSGINILNRDDVIRNSQLLSEALNGDTDRCFFIAENFSSDKWPENADSYLAFQWNVYQQIQLDIFSEWYKTSNLQITFTEGKLLFLFGNVEQRASVLQMMDEFVNSYGHSMLMYSQVEEYISMLAGVFPEEVFRAQLDFVINKERAIEVYKGLIDSMKASGYSSIDAYARNLEPILGITYYVPAQKSGGSAASKTAGSSASQSSEPAKKGGCYVATCVYGSYDCPEVWTLRRFRDEILAQGMPGRLFIRMYYAISPSVVRIWGGNEIIRSVWKFFLDQLVGNLKKRGIQDNPYED